MALLNVGMPGVGLGGIFYLVGALAMPFVEIGRAMRARLAGERRPRDARRWALALRQSSLAVGVLGAAWVAGLAIGRLRALGSGPERATAGARSSIAASPLRVSTLLFGVLLLVVVLGGV